MTRRSIALIALALMLSACQSSSAKTAPPDTTAKVTTTTIIAALSCGPQREDCTSAQVIATVAYIWEKAGATPSEAACLAPITASGKHAVNEAFDVYTPKQTADSIACVGSERRMRKIANVSAAYLTSHPNL